MTAQLYRLPYCLSFFKIQQSEYIKEQGLFKSIELLTDGPVFSLTDFESRLLDSEMTMRDVNKIIEWVIGYLYTFETLSVLLTRDFVKQGSNRTISPCN